MEPGLSGSEFTEFSPEERRILLDLARESIRGRSKPEGLSPRLCRPGACFVTLLKGGRLRGCIGNLEPRAPLWKEVADNARAAAFADPRFEPLQPSEEAEVEIHISVLGPRRPLPASGEAELISKLRPGLDGLVLQEGRRRATFLPSVWEQLPQPEDFVRHLKMKAGLPPDHWSGEMRFWTYEVVEIR